jgi:hypothetical protein
VEQVPITPTHEMATVSAASAERRVVSASMAPAQQLKRG